MSAPNYPPPPGWPPPPQPESEKKPAIHKPSTWWWMGAAFVLGLIFGAPIGNGSDAPATAAADRSPSTVAASPRASAPATPAAAPPVQTGPQTSFGDGTWVVGTDIEPGTYRSSGAQAGFFEFCSWSRLAGATSDADALSFGTANAEEPIVVEIKPSDGAFKASGCATFTKVG